MARFNPYGNSQIADSISGIARALIGSADTDAALARARASDATARYKDSQTNYQNQLSNYLNQNTAAIDDVMADSGQVKQLFESFGLKSNIGQSIPDGGVGDFIAPNDVTPAATDAMRGLVRAMLFGGVPGNPQQSAAAGQTLANMVNQQEAYRLLEKSGQSPDRQAAIRLDYPLGEFFDAGSKAAEIKAEANKPASPSSLLKYSTTDQNQVYAAGYQQMDILGYGDYVPERVKSGIISGLETEAKNQYQQNKSIDAATNYVQSKLKEQFQGRSLIWLDDKSTEGQYFFKMFGVKDLAIPGFVLNEMQGLMSTATTEEKGKEAMERAKQRLTDLGYTAKEQTAILQYLQMSTSKGG